MASRSNEASGRPTIRLRRLVASLTDFSLIVLTVAVGWLIWSVVLWRRGQTPGKQLVGLELSTLDGGPVPARVVALRELLKYGSFGGLVLAAEVLPPLALLWYIAAAWCLWDGNRQCLWDKPFGTGVRRRVTSHRADAISGHPNLLNRVLRSRTKRVNASSGWNPVVKGDVSPAKPSLEFTASTSKQTAPSNRDKRKPRYEVACTYEGGHPSYAGQRSRGKLRVLDEILEFEGGRIRLELLLGAISRVELNQMQFGLTRTILAHDAVALQSQRPMVHIRCDIGGTEHELRFHVHGAATIPGESKKARELADHLHAAISAVQRPTEKVTGLIPDEVAQPASPNSEGEQVEPLALLRRLDVLRAEGLITETDYNEKKRELLDRL